MKSTIIYEPTGQRVNLAGSVSAEIFAWLESLQGKCPGRPAVLRCGGCQGALFLRHDPGSRDRLHGVHHIRTGCQTLVISRSVMSDEHKRQAEYHALAGQAVGLAADMEVLTSGSTRVDVVLGGRIGIEVQRSGLTLGAAKSRTERSMKAGLDVVGWFTDRPARPVWYDRVPSYTTRARSWDELPKLGTVMTWARRIEAVRCVLGAFEKCPAGERRPCGKYHPKYPPQPMLVDDLVGRLAAGEIVAAVTGRHVRLVPRSSLQVYEELTGTPALYSGTLPAQSGAERPAERIECTRPIQPGWFVRAENCKQLQLDLYSRPTVTLVRNRTTCDVPGCAQPGRLYAAGLRCDRHRPVPYLSANQIDGTT